MAVSARASRHRAIAALALAIGCRDVIGIEARTEGPPLLPLSEACLACVDAGCAGVERACAADADCAALAACIAEAGLDAPVGRTACIDSFPRGATTDAFAALDACSRSKCLDDCYGPAGFFGAYGPACESCTEAACFEQMKDCVADAACERGAARAYGDPGDLNPAAIRPFILTPGDAGREERELFACPGGCPEECGFGGRDFRCVGQYQWPTQIPPRADVELLVLKTDASLAAHPLPGAKVDACAAAAPQCAPIASAVADDTGLAKLTVPLAGQSGFRGFARITADTADGPIIPSHLMAFPILGGLRAFGYTVSEQQFDISFGFLGTQRLPQRAHFLVIFNDCTSRRAPGMRIELPPDAVEDATIYHPESTDDTGDDGWVTVLNAVPGCYELVGRNADGVETHRLRVRAEPDVWTIVLMEPTSDPPDLGYTCVPDF